MVASSVAIAGPLTINPKPQRAPIHAQPPAGSAVRQARYEHGGGFLEFLFRRSCSVRAGRVTTPRATTTLAIPIPARRSLRATHHVQRWIRAS